MKPYALKTPNNLSRSDQRKKKHDTGHNTSDSKPVIRKK